MKQLGTVDEESCNSIILTKKARMYNHYKHDEF